VREKPREAALVAEPEAASLLDVVDNLLNKGVVVTGDVVLGIAGIDLVYLRLSAVLCAIDRVSPHGSPALPPSNRARGRGRAASRP
jgi:hypothetical protein